MVTTTPPRLPPHFRVETEADLGRIPFVDGFATVEVPAKLLPEIDMTQDDRGDSPRLRALEASIRSKGYRPVEPISAQVGRRGEWVIVNGGHRITAARHVMREFWANLFGRRVNNLYFILQLTPESWGDGTPPPDVVLPGVDDGFSLEERASWERSQDRMRAGRLTAKDD